MLRDLTKSLLKIKYLKIKKFRRHVFNFICLTSYCPNLRAIEQIPMSLSVEKVVSKKQC